MSIPFWWLWGAATAVSLVVLYFFFTGLADGSVSSFNMKLWMILLLIAIGLPLAAIWMRSHDYVVIARILLWILAAPGFFYLMFILIMIIGKPKWN